MIVLVGSLEKASQFSLCVGHAAFWQSREQYLSTLHFTHRDLPGLEQTVSLPQSLPGPSGMLKAFAVRNIAGLLSEIAPGFSNAYAGSIVKRIESLYCVVYR